MLLPSNPKRKNVFGSSRNLSVPVYQLTTLYYYQAVIRPLLEYTCVVWHSSLSEEQSQSLENVQRRALR